MCVCVCAPLCVHHTHNTDSAKSKNTATFIVSLLQQQLHQHQQRQAFHQSAASLAVSNSEANNCMDLMPQCAAFGPEQQHSDYIVADYMEKIGTRIDILETELKYAWSALDLLSTEYGKMWTRMEKLEKISMEQRSIVTNLMGLYGATSLNATIDHAGNTYASAADLSDMLGHTYDTVENANMPFGDPGGRLGGGADGSMQVNRISADIRHLQEQQKQIEHNIQHNERLFNELNALSYSNSMSHMLGEKRMPDAVANSAAGGSGTANNTNSIRQLLGSSIKDGLEEGIDLVERERLRQRYGSDAPANLNAADWYMLRDLMPHEAQNERSDADFFRSGEINRDLYSNKMDSETAGLYAELGAFGSMAQQLAQNKVLSIGSDGNLIEILVPADAAAMVEHQLQQQQLQLQLQLQQQQQQLQQQMVGISRPVSSLGMIYEDNEEQENEHQSSASEVDEMLLFADKKSLSGSASGQSAKVSPTSTAAGKKSKKKKSHRRHDDLDEPAKPRPAASPVKMSKDETIDFIIDEIGKIEDITLFTSDQIESLRQLIDKEFTLFNKINQSNKHLLLILLNPITSSDVYESTQQRCDQLKHKLHKNIGILSTMLDTQSDLSDIKPNEAIDIDEILETSSTICGDDDRSERTLSAEALPKLLGGKRFDPLGSIKSGDCYSQHLMQHNYSLDEQLKHLDSRENEIMCKKSIKSITEELEASERKNLLDNFDESSVLSDVNRAQSFSQLSGLRNDSHQYSSNSSIYSNDEYIKSLKKSLERHNSMLFLLHLQNSNYQSCNDIHGDAKKEAIAGT